MPAAPCACVASYVAVVCSTGAVPVCAGSAGCGSELSSAWA
ncbi:hypothetical protein JBKA6_0878 [Ichthyobacterium seriolicida]|uniref:Uncharacterized protein n=1 Tax=Ichthyobacterium seriolicida TaxID=242600 RepID=A0A1J1EAD0_9FLAO|nr:hypothetical protein JBKA6_0878 [Ichthyobacterium seriolicida]